MGVHWQVNEAIMELVKAKFPQESAEALADPSLFGDFRDVGKEAPTADDPPSADGAPPTEVRHTTPPMCTSSLTREAP